MPSLNHVRWLTQAPRLDGHLPEPYDPGNPPGKTTEDAAGDTAAEVAP